MADLSVLDLSLARIRKAEIDPADAPALIATEKVWKKRKAVLAYLKRMLPPAEVRIECVVANLHLGDGRQLGQGERALVSREVAELIVGRARPSMSAEWELIDSDPGTGLRKWMGYDSESDSVLVSYEQDRAALAAILDANKSAQAEAFDRRSDFWHAAQIPIGVMYEWKVKHGVDAWDPNHKPAVMRLLNDPDYRYLRVRHFII